MVTDGEFNSLRTQGETRPVHILQVIHNVRESVSRQKERTLLKMLTKICDQGICGFSRETVIAVTTNIESIEYRRRQNLELGYEEHPRAGTTDDVEAIFALFHRFLGNIFTLKEFKQC
ncbi:hypothetical protein QZH41_017930 [Actinostola sp. cb2023]|nr:hypothetical protein QZH41_017930 [Actinostola sp. cb2023]